MFNGCSYPAFGGCGWGWPRGVAERGVSSVGRFRIRTFLYPADFESVKGNIKPYLNSAALQDRQFENYCDVLSLIFFFIFSLRWLWTEAGAQSDLESSLGIGGFGYPAMAAVNARKMKFALLKGSFSEQGINEFLRYEIFK